MQNFLENISKYKLHAKNKFLCDNQVLFYKAHFKHGLKVLFTVAVRSYKYDRQLEDLCAVPLLPCYMFCLLFGLLQLIFNRHCHTEVVLEDGEFCGYV